MSDLITLKRNLAQESINKNPTTLTVTRIENIENVNGGRTELAPTTYNATVRITKVNNASLVVNEDAGKYKIYNGAVVLASYDSDFNSNVNNYVDTFSYDGLKYKIISVMNNSEKGSITSKQVICEVV